MPWLLKIFYASATCQGSFEPLTLLSAVVQIPFLLLQMVEAMFDPSKKKKKKAKKVTEENSTDALAESSAGASTVTGDDASASATVTDSSNNSSSSAALAECSHAHVHDEEMLYEDMLSRIYGLLYANNPDLTDR